MKHWYKNLEKRFSTFEPETQILHMVSDLFKANNLKDINIESSKNHLYRAIILLDYITSDPKWSTKLRELLRLREVLASVIVDQSPLATIDQVIKATLLLDPRAYAVLGRGGARMNLEG